MPYNVSRPREVVKPANWVVSAKIEFIRENEAEARKNQQFLVTAVMRGQKPFQLRSAFRQ